jgi:hypothetical protein
MNLEQEMRELIIIRVEVGKEAAVQTLLNALARSRATYSYSLRII